VQAVAFRVIPKRLDLNGDYKIFRLQGMRIAICNISVTPINIVFSGFTLGGSWKGIDVNAMFQGVGKQYVIRNDWMAYPFQTRTANQNPHIWERHGQRAIRMLNSLA
jgi:hypothetical protein